MYGNNNAVGLWADVVGVGVAMDDIDFERTTYLAERCYSLGYQCGREIQYFIDHRLATREHLRRIMNQQRINILSALEYV